MADPLEGVDARGMIMTGARRDRVPSAFEPIVATLTDEISQANPDAEVHLYGSVATGQAQVGRSDVDVLTIGLESTIAADIGKRLTVRFADVCREVSIAAAVPRDLDDDHDEGYGFQVFLRHYCVHLAGPHDCTPTHDFPADDRAARGFNGDIAWHVARWRRAADTTDDLDTLATRVARKTLLAVGGLVSMHDATWITDRRRAAERWGEIHPELTDGLRQLEVWMMGSAGVTRSDLGRVIDDTVQPVADQFAGRIGLWPDELSSSR